MTLYTGDLVLVIEISRNLLKNLWKLKNSFESKDFKVNLKK